MKEKVFPVQNQNLVYTTIHTHSLDAVRLGFSSAKSEPRLHNDSYTLSGCGYRVGNPFCNKTSKELTVAVYVEF